MDGEAYEEAIAVYEGILRGEPGDTEAIVGLKDAKQKFFDKRLIQVRKAREGGSPMQAMDLLMGVFQKQKEWNFYPTGKVGLTQDDEVEEAFRYVTHEGEVALVNDHPLKAELLARTYGPIYQGKYPNGYEQLRRRNKEGGKKSCDKLQTENFKDRPYLADFLREYCEYWGVTLKKATGMDQEAQGLFVRVSAAPTVTGLPAEMNPILGQSLQAALERTAWFDARGRKTIPLAVTGTYNQLQNRTLVQLSQEYTVQEPYTDYEDVPHTRRVPYEDANHQTQYRNETYYEREPVTRFRPAIHTYPYEAAKHFQHFSWAVKGEGSFGDQSVLFDRSENLDHECIQHDLDLPNIGLKPRPLDLIDPFAWMKGEASLFGAQFQQKAGALWVALYCSDTGVTSFADTGNRVQRCLRQPQTQPPAFAMNWYDRYIGVTPEQAGILLGATGK
jgi:hypothetical protein